jgi:hypothetical protein
MEEPKTRNSKSKSKTLIPEGLLPSYLASAFGDLYEEDGLLVLGKGLGLLNLIASFVRFYADTKEGHLSLLQEQEEGSPLTKGRILLHVEGHTHPEVTVPAFCLVQLMLTIHDLILSSYGNTNTEIRFESSSCSSGAGVGVARVNK